jgi:ribonucleoside-diphosphate reductase alpha chain
MDNMYKLAWVRGLKTTYYLRSMGATAAEKTTTAAPTAPPAVIAPVLSKLIVVETPVALFVSVLEATDDFELGEG